MHITCNGLRWFYSALVFTWLCIAISCATIQDKTGQPQSHKGQLTLYLKGPEKPKVHILFDLLSVTIIAEDGTAREITDVPGKIDSRALRRRQILLGETALPEGKYQKIRFIVKQALITREDGTAQLALPEEGIDIAVDVEVIHNQNTPLFVTWNPDASVKDGYLFQPALTVMGQRTELSALLLYVTNEGSDNVSVINRKTGGVVATVMVGKKPKGITSSSLKENPRVYVANSGSDSISVIEPNTNKVEKIIPVRSGKEPTGIAVTRVSPGREMLFVSNYRTNSVSVFDADSFQEMESIKVGRGPIDLVIDPPVDTVLSSRHLSADDISLLRSFRRKFFNVYVVNENSSDVTVVKMNISSMAPEEVQTISVDWRPVSLELDYQRGKLYVANYGSDKLSVIDILSIVRGNITGAVSTINDVGTFVTGVISDPAFERLYLLKEIPGQILILRPFSANLQILEAAMSPVMGIIPVGDRPRSLVLDTEIRKLFVVNRGSENVSVIDQTTRRETGVIPVGSRPYDIAIVEGNNTR